MISRVRPADGAAPPKERAPAPRPARTRAAILAAVEQLPALSPESVTVTSLVAQAGVSRSVFSTHFPSMEALLSAVILETAATATASATPNTVGEREGSARGDVPTPRVLTARSLTAILEHVDSRGTFYSAALLWKTSFGVQDVATRGYTRRLQELTEQVRASTADPAIPAPASVGFAATFVAGGIIAALTEWLRAGRPTSVADLVGEMLALMPAWLLVEQVDGGRVESGGGDESHSPRRAGDPL